MESRNVMLMSEANASQRLDVLINTGHHTRIRTTSNAVW
eukprot:SAG11_NODE_1932_length_4043_cov_4.892748_1_plen_39_part_00